MNNCDFFLFYWRSNMYSTGNKKMLNMLILDILKEYSDEEHHLSQQKILRILKSTYGMECDRRSVKNNIIYLQELGYEISTDDGYWLMQRELENSELQLLIDSVLFSRLLSKKQTKALVDKLCAMGNKYFRNSVKRRYYISDINYSDDNKQLLYTLDTVNEAITKGKKISALFHHYDIEGQLKPKRNNESIWSPYQIILSGGKYYLMGNLNNSEHITPTRLDKLKNVKILDEAAKPRNQFKEQERFEDSYYMNGNDHLFGGPKTTAKILTEEWMINEIVDWVGTDLRLKKTSVEGQVEVTFRVNDMALFFWALQYGPFIEIIEPVEMREDLINAAKRIYNIYSETKI